jgi:NADH-quinone oxidoreductase subunit M
VIFGVLDKASLASIADLSPREIAIFVPLLALTIYYGVWPGPVLEASAASVANLLNSHSALLHAVHIAAAGQ